MRLTIQTHLEHEWRDAAVLELPEPELGTRGPARLEYLQAHALDWMFRDDEHACSLVLPVELGEPRALATGLVGLETRLRERGVPERILTMPAVGLTTLETRLERWGLL